MSEDRIDWLVQEVRDDLDAGDVGLYEFVWTLRGAKVTPEDEYRAIARAALDRLLADPMIELVELRWADPTFCERADAGRLDARSFDDIDDDRLYFAVRRRQT